MKIRYQRSHAPKTFTIISLLLVLTFLGTIQPPPTSSSESASPRSIFSTGLLQGDLVNSSPITETLILRNSTIVPDNNAPINQDSSTQLDYPTSVIYVSNSNPLYDYLIHFSVAFHGSVELRVQFGPTPQTLFGIQTPLFYLITSTLAATLVGAVVVVKRRWPEISKRLTAAILID